MTGAKYFADSLAANNGDFLKTLGKYNGWEEGMDVVSILLPVASFAMLMITPPGLRYAHALDLLPRPEQP